MSGRTPQQVLWEARELAATRGLFIVEATDTVGERRFTVYIVYRRAANGARGTRIGKRRDAIALLQLVRGAAGVAA